MSYLFYRMFVDIEVLCVGGIGFMFIVVIYFYVVFNCLFGMILYVIVFLFTIYCVGIFVRMFIGVCVNFIVNEMENVVRYEYF